MIIMEMIIMEIVMIIEETIDDPRRLTIIVIDKDSYPFHENSSNKYFTKPQKK